MRAVAEHSADYGAGVERIEQANAQWVFDRLKADHQASIWSSAMRWGWACSCGRGGSTDTNGRATAARDAHLTAERKKLQAALREAGLTTPLPPGEGRTPEAGDPS